MSANLSMTEREAAAIVIAAAAAARVGATSAAGRAASFRDFIARVNPRYQWYAHCQRLADVLQEVADGKVKRLMVFMPPRHGKSELVSRLFSAYYLARHPDKWVGINSYAAELAYTLSRSARENYTRLGHTVRDDAGAVKHWETGQGGGLWAAGVGGPITGKGFHLGIIDDPLKNAEEAASEVTRAKQRDWYGSTFYTREEPEGAIIVIQTRWHEDDLSGHLLAEEADAPEGWRVVSYEAIKERSAPQFPASCQVEPDWRAEGEALCPERYPLPKLRKIAKKIGGYYWSALYQQRPTAKEGLTFKVSKLEIVEAAPASARRVRFWDKAATASGGDFTVGVRIAASADGLFYIEDAKRGQWDSAERDAEIKQVAQLDGQAVRIGGEQEPGASGKDMARQFIRMLAGFNVTVKPASGSKEVRADALSAQVNAGNVRLVKGAWNKAFIEEMRSFPLGAHDDQVDAASGAFNMLFTPEQESPELPATFGYYAGGFN